MSCIESSHLTCFGCFRVMLVDTVVELKLKSRQKYP